jgi:uncharacterized protein (TIGR02594 family)
MTLSALLAGAALRQGASGEAVRTIQLALRDLGYPLSGTGYFGPATDTAIEDFQRRHRLAVDGVVGEATARAIEGALRVATGSAADQVDPPALWLSVSLSHVGLREMAGSADNVELVDMIRSVADDYQVDATPWCAGWVSYCLAKAGLKPSSSPLWALSYARGWGVRLAAPALGAIAVNRQSSAMTPWRANGGKSVIGRLISRVGGLPRIGSRSSTSLRPIARAVPAPPS